MHQIALDWIGRYSYAGLFSLLVLGIVGVPIPDEWLLVFCGYLVFKHDLRFVPVVAAGFSGAACGISISYVCGYSFGADLLVRYGHVVHVTGRRIERALDWFTRLGRWTLFVGYFIPGVRHLTAFVAGMSRLHFRDFALFAFTGAFFWAVTFISIGYLLGGEWSRFAGSNHSELGIGVGVIAAGLVAYCSIG